MFFKKTREQMLDRIWQGYSKYLDDENVSVVKAVDGGQVIFTIDGIPRDVLTLRVTETADSISIEFEEYLG